MPSQVATVQQYLADLPDDRRAALAAVRAVILENIDKKNIEEGMQYGMIGYYVPHRVFPAGYHCDPRQPLPYAALASQKHHMAIYLMSAYGDTDHEQWLRDAWAKAGKKLDMGKSCIRFKRIDEVPLDVLGEAIRRVPARAFIERYESVLQTNRKAKKTTAKKATAKKTTAKKTTAKKTTAKKTAAKKTAAKKTPATAPARAALRA